VGSLTPSCHYLVVRRLPSDSRAGSVSDLGKVLRRCVPENRVQMRAQIVRQIGTEVSASRGPKKEASSGLQVVGT
jgi:hypothetical protein